MVSHIRGGGGKRVLVLGNGGGGDIPRGIIKWRLQSCCLNILRNYMSIVGNKVLKRTYQIHCRSVDFLNSCKELSFVKN